MAGRQEGNMRGWIWIVCVRMVVEGRGALAQVSRRRGWRKTSTRALYCPVTATRR